MEKIIVWGAGIRGLSIASVLNDRIEAFIDSDENKIGTFIFKKEVISYSQYKENVNKRRLLISINDSELVEKQLQNDGIKDYWLLKECPFQYYAGNVEQVNMIENIIKEDICCYQSYIVYGDNFFSEIICEIVDKKRGNLKRVKSLNELLLNTVIVDVRDILLVTKECSDAEWKELQDLKIQIKDLYNLSNDKNLFYKKNIEKYKGINSGKRCFIVATGPSLEVSDLDKLYKYNEICIGLNKLYKSFSSTLLRPKYYVISDKQFITENMDILQKLETDTLFINDDSLDFLNSNSNETVETYHISRDVSTGDYKFSDDAAEVLYAGNTVTYVAIQMAVYMGFKTIYLLGVDCNYTKGSTNNYFFADEKEDNFDHKENEMIRAYMSARKYADSHDIKIYNATRGGMLEVFERVDFDSLFEK